MRPRISTARHVVDRLVTRTLDAVAEAFTRAGVVVGVLVVFPLRLAWLALDTVLLLLDELEYRL